MLTSLLEVMTSTLQKFVDSLDLDYIVCLLLLCYVANKYIDSKIRWLAYLKTRYRVFIIGTAYGLIVYLLRGQYTVSAMESMFKSYLFAVVLYSLVIEVPLAYFESYLVRRLKSDLSIKQEEAV